ncbi:hypothetical protein ACFIJ5_02830 [Haloimpatiens sp. FM7330]
MKIKLLYGKIICEVLIKFMLNNDYEFIVYNKNKSLNIKNILQISGSI